TRMNRNEPPQMAPSRVSSTGVRHAASAVAASAVAGTSGVDMQPHPGCARGAPTVTGAGGARHPILAQGADLTPAPAGSLPAGPRSPRSPPTGAAAHR